MDQVIINVICGNNIKVLMTIALGGGKSQGKTHPKAQDMEN